MAFEEIAALCAAQGLRCNPEEGTVSGVRQGVAFRVTVPAGKAELSINVDEKLLPNILTPLAPFGAFAVLEGGSGVCLSSAAITAMTGEQLLSFLDTAIGAAISLAENSFDDTFEKDGEAVSAYLRGILGAFVGALVGVLPWFLGENLLGFSLWYFGALVGIGSFFGYRYLWGAHSTRFAFAVIAVCSLTAMLLSQAASTVWWVMSSLETVNTVGDAIAFVLENGGILGFFEDSLFGIVACAAGLFGMRGKILLYTHESNYLRRGRKRK